MLSTENSVADNNQSFMESKLCGEQNYDTEHTLDWKYTRVKVAIIRCFRTHCDYVLSKIE